MSIIVSMKPYWSIEVGDVACESSSLSMADTANVGMAWEASSTEYCRCYGSKRGKCARKKIFFIFFNNIPSIVVVSNQNNEKCT